MASLKHVNGHMSSAVLCERWPAAAAMRGRSGPCTCPKPLLAMCATHRRASNTSVTLVEGSPFHRLLSGRAPQAVGKLFCSSGSGGRSGSSERTVAGAVAVRGPRETLRTRLMWYLVPVDGMFLWRDVMRGTLFGGPFCLGSVPRPHGQQPIGRGPTGRRP